MPTASSTVTPRVSNLVANGDFEASAASPTCTKGWWEGVGYDVSRAKSDRDSGFTIRVNVGSSEVQASTLTDVDGHGAAGNVVRIYGSSKLFNG